MSTLAKIQESAEDRFRRHWGEAQSFGRKTVEQAWCAGKALIEVRKDRGWGNFKGWLEVEGVSQDIAYRMIKLAERATDNLQIANFGSVDEALRSLPAPEPKGKPRGRPALPEPDPEPDPVLSPAEETEVRLEEQIQRADALDSELAEVKDQIYVMEKSGGDSAKGMVARSDFETLNENYSKTFALLKKRDRKLNAIKRDLLNGQTADDVLGRHFGLTRI